MTFNQAYKEAMARSASFRKHDERVKEAMAKGEQSACLTFGIDGEAFYYGFDGVDMHKGKHTSRRSQVLHDRDHVLLIL